MKYALVLLSVIALGCVAFAADQPPKSQAERERSVRVALALADVSTKPNPPPAPTKTVKAKFDWFGEGAAGGKDACPCGSECVCAPGTCPAGCEKVKPQPPKPTAPAKAEVTYRTELRQQCVTDRWGRQSCQWVEYLVPVGGK